MAHVINRNYNKFADPQTKVEFTRVLDPETNTFICHAETDADFSGRLGFETMDDGEWAAFNARHVPEEPTHPVTGDPLGDLGFQGGPNAASERLVRPVEGQEAFTVPAPSEVKAKKAAGDPAPITGDPVKDASNQDGPSAQTSDNAQG